MVMVQENPLPVFESWFRSQKHGKAPVPKGTIAGALAVLERLKVNFELDLKKHLTHGGGQIQGANGQSLSRILAQYGEHRHFASEGGRTNRGLLSAIESMLHAIAQMKLERLSKEQRNTVLAEFQAFLVDRVKEFHNKERIKFIYDPSLSAWQSIYNLLEATKKDGKAGPVAQHLVGAKLQLRFPDKAIGRESYSTADMQLGRPGDFTIGDTSFHVTVAPMSALYEKCKRNIADGYRPFVLVPFDKLVGVRQIADEVGQGKIASESIESFISQNMEEMSDFSINKLAENLYQLLEEYNSRIDEAESDKSFLIEIPKNLSGKSSKET